MGQASRRGRFWVRLGIVLGIWTVLAFVLTGQAYLFIHSAKLAQADLPRQPASFGLVELFYNALAESLLWVPLTLGVFWLGKRFPFGQGRWPRSLLVHVAACLLFGFVQTVLMVGIAEIVRHDIPKPTITPNVLMHYFVAKLNNNAFFYWAILAVTHILNYYRQLQDRELRASQLETRLAQTQLQMLKMQLHPHFLFNTLHAISALIHKDVELADRMIARLGDLLRATLENANKQEVPFKEELDFIEPYLEIEKARLGARLTIHMDIDPRVMDARVPNMLLQPLVENAIRHGIAPRVEPGRIEIHAQRQNGRLRLDVTDDGPGAPSPVAPGIGLTNTRARLEMLYGAAQRLELTTGPGGGGCT
jgi:two-component system LytT family sensor kinase